MPAITLPLSFNNSFWTQDYRRGLETLFNKLEQGVLENEEITNFIEARVNAEFDLAQALTMPVASAPRGTGFAADDGASLLMAFWGLKQETKAQGDGHRAVANDLQALALQPFASWSKGHAQRVKDAKINVLDLWVGDYEQALEEVNKLRETYYSKTRKADEAEDDAKFAPNTDYSDHYTATSPRQNGRNAVVNRTPSVSERIAERLRELRGNKAEGEDASSVTVLHSEDKADGEITPTLPKVDKGKGKAVETSSPLAMSPVAASAPLPPAKPEPMLLAGIAMSPAAVSALLRRARDELPLRPVRLPIIGEYPDCFTGEEFVNWLRENVEAFGGSLDHAAEAARELGEDEGLLRRIGEIGNVFEVSNEAFYQFRPKAFNLEEARADNLKAPAANLQPMADNLLKRSGTLANFVMKQIKSNSNIPPHVKARQEAQEADEAYKKAVRQLDRQRLALEDRIEETLKLLQKWELDRLRIIKDVLLKYHATLSNTPSHIQPSMERASTLIASYQPESDLNALIERYRTGPFRPAPHIYESVSHDMIDVSFGFDLRRWAGESGWAAVRVPEDEKKPNAIPPLLRSLLEALEKAYTKLPTDEDKRRTWIYEIPLPVLHHLREALNSQPPDTEVPVEFFEKVDAPVLAGITRLWLLELDPPVCMWEGWDDIRKIYPAVGAKLEVSEAQHIENVQNALFKVPKVHLYVLDAVIKHLKSLIDNTKSEEDPEIYLTKLAFSLGRALLRPRQETHISIQDRHPTLLFIDLIKHYDAILPPTVTKKKRESEKPLPVRKRTTLVDQRINRRSVAANPKQLLEAREAQIRAPSPRPEIVTKPPTPPPAKQKDTDLPPRPKFTTPPPERDEPATASQAAPVVVQPTSTEQAQSPTSPKQPASPPMDVGKASLLEDKPAASGASLTRSGSGETSRVRKPGGARGPRAAPGAAASGGSYVHHRLSSYGSAAGDAAARPKSPITPVADPKEYVPKKKDGRTSAGTFARLSHAEGGDDTK